MLRIIRSMEAEKLTSATNTVDLVGIACLSGRAEWMSAMWVEICPYHILLLCSWTTDHTDWQTLIRQDFCRCVCSYRRKKQTRPSEKTNLKHKTPNNQTNRNSSCRVCMKCFCVYTHVVHHWLHHLRPCGLWGLITHTAPLLYGLSLTVMWLLLMWVPHNTHICTRMHKLTSIQKKHAKINNPAAQRMKPCRQDISPGSHLANVAPTPVHVSQKGHTHEQGSQLRSLIIFSTVSGNLSHRGGEDKNVRPKGKIIFKFSSL